MLHCDTGDLHTNDEGGHQADEVFYYVKDPQEKKANVQTLCANPTPYEDDETCGSPDDDEDTKVGFPLKLPSVSFKSSNLKKKTD